MRCAKINHSIGISIIMTIMGFSAVGRSLDDFSKERYSKEFGSIYENALDGFRTQSRLIFDTNLTLRLTSIENPVDELDFRLNFPFSKSFVHNGKTPSTSFCSKTNSSLFALGNKSISSFGMNLGSFINSKGTQIYIRLHKPNSDWWVLSSDVADRLNNKLERFSDCPLTPKEKASMYESVDIDLTGLTMTRFKSCHIENGCKNPISHYRVNGSINVRKKELPEVLSFAFSHQYQIIDSILNDLENTSREGADFFGDQKLWFGSAFTSPSDNPPYIYTRRCISGQGRACHRHLIGSTQIDSHDIENFHFVDLWIQD